MKYGIVQMTQKSLTLIDACKGSSLNIVKKKKNCPSNLHVGIKTQSRIQWQTCLMTTVASQLKICNFMNSKLDICFLKNETG